MDIKLLRYFIAVAREGSLTKASEHLHVTQPALSRQLHDLERELGCKLFERKSRGMTLTEDGMLLREQARMILAMVDKTEASFKTREEGIRGEVFIGGAETDLFRIIGRIAKNLHDKHPGITFNLYAGNQEMIGERLDRGLLDFGLLMEPADLSKYQYLPLPETDVWGLLMRKDDPLAKKEVIQLEDLMDVPLFISRQSSQTTYSQNIFTEWFGDAFESLNIVGTFDLLSNTARFVEEGFGCAFSVERLIGLDPDRNLTFRPLDPPLSPRSDIAWWPYRVFSPAATLFLDELKKTLK